MLPDELSIHKHIDPAPCASLPALPLPVVFSSPALAGALASSPTPARRSASSPCSSAISPACPQQDAAERSAATLRTMPQPHPNGAWSPQNECSAPPGAPGARACRRRTRSACQRSWVRIGYPLSGRAERCTLQYRPRVRASFLAMSSSRGCGGMLALCSASSTSTICRLRQQGAPTGVRRVPPWRRDR